MNENTTETVSVTEENPSVFSVTATLEGDVLHAEAETGNLQPTDMLYYALLRENTILESVSGKQQTTHEFRLTEPGIYRVKFTVKRGEERFRVMSKTVRYGMPKPEKKPLAETVCGQRLTVVLKIDKNRLLAHAEPKLDGVEYRFSLKKDRLPIETTDWSPSAQAEFTVTETGIYSVFAFAKYQDEMTRCLSAGVEYYTEEDEKRVQAFIDEHRGYEPDELSYAPNRAPYQDLALIYTRDVRIPYDLPRCTEIGLKRNGIKISKNGQLYVLSHSTVSFDGNFILLSGKANCNGKLIYGQEDMTPDFRVAELTESIGYFTFLSYERSERTFRFENDYFGMGKIYYYHKNGISIFANRYHLLLQILADIGVKAKLNNQKLATDFASTLVPMFHSSVCRETDIEDIICVPLDQKICINATGVHFEKTGIYEDITARQPYSAEEYHKLLKQAAYEVVDNVRCVVNSDRFDTVFFDLTGGLDSRAAFAATNRLCGKDDRIRLCSLDKNGRDGGKGKPIVSYDVPIACRLNSFYGYRWDDAPELNRQIPTQQYLDSRTSYYLGNYFFMNGAAGCDRRQDRRFRITGGCGEIVGRPYFARVFLNTALEQAKDETEFAQMYVDHYSEKMLSASEELKKVLASRLASELKRLPGKTLLQKLDSHYLYYRDRYIIDDGFVAMYNEDEWSPLMTKSLFRAHHLWSYTDFRSIKAILDLIRVLNPIFANMPFDSESDNRDAEQFADTLIPVSPIFQNLTGKVDETNEMAAWKSAGEAKRKVSAWERNEAYLTGSDLMEYLRKQVEDQLGYLLRTNAYIREHLGVALIRWLDKNGDSAVHLSRMQIRLASACAQIRLFQKMI